MSLETELAANTAALTAQTAAINAQTDFLKSMAAKGGAATTGAAAAATGTKAATPKPSTPKAKTIEDIRTAASAFLGVTDPDERTANKAKMKAMLDHFGVDRATNIPVENFAEALGYIEQFTKGETPDFMNEAEAGGDMV
jgi:hypothetical protein